MTNILEEANKLVHGERNKDYGHPLDDFNTVAAMMTALLQRSGKLAPGAKLDYRDHVLWMECVKMVREGHVPKTDNRIDGAGYWETLQMCVEEEEWRNTTMAAIPPAQRRGDV